MKTLKYSFLKNPRFFVFLILGTILGILFWTSYSLEFSYGLYFRLSVPIIWIIYMIIIGIINNQKRSARFASDLFSYFTGNAIGTILFMIFAGIFGTGAIIFYLIKQIFNF